MSTFVETDTWKIRNLAWDLMSTADIDSEEVKILVELVEDLCGLVDRLEHRADTL